MNKKKMFTAIYLLPLFLALLLLHGCSSVPVEGPTDSGAEKISYIDSVKREVEIPASITRVAPSGTMAQIILFSLAPDKLVGLSERWSQGAEQYLDPAYYNLPVLGQFYGGKGNHNLEEIARVGPELIIDIGEPKSSIVEDMDQITGKVGIPAVHITATLETMGDAYRELGRLLGLEKEAAVLAGCCDEIYRKMEKIMGTVGDEGKVDLLYCSGDDGLNVIARGSFHAEVIDLLSNNAAVVEDISSKGMGNPVDLEQILLWDPAVIIFSPDSIYGKVAGDPAWQDLRAIREGRYYEVPGEPYNWMGFPPSLNRFMGILWMLQLLYPEEAGCDLQAETVKFYELFYHCKLSEQQYNELVARSILKDR